MDKSIDLQGVGLERLDTVTYLLEWYGDSRTDAFSAIGIHDFTFIGQI